jgi:hypothetical protein
MKKLISIITVLAISTGMLTVTASADWQTVDGQKKYYYRDGEMLKNVMTTIDGTRFIFDKNGIANIYTGWSEQNGKKYYYGTSGIKVTDCWYPIYDESGHAYYSAHFDKDGLCDKIGGYSAVEDIASYAIREILGDDIFVSLHYNDFVFALKVTDIDAAKEKLKEKFPNFDVFPINFEKSKYSLKQLNETVKALQTVSKEYGIRLVDFDGVDSVEAYVYQSTQALKDFVKSLPYGDCVEIWADGQFVED